jgi:hypothetical protein
VYVDHPNNPLDSERAAVSHQVNGGPVTKRGLSETLPPHSPLRTLPDSDAKNMRTTGGQSIGHLTTSVGGRSKYVGSTFWACVGAVGTVGTAVSRVFSKYIAVLSCLTGGIEQ